MQSNEVLKKQLELAQSRDISLSAEVSNPPPEKPDIPQAAIDMLKGYSNTEEEEAMKADFDAIFGVGAADRVLGGN